MGQNMVYLGGVFTPILVLFSTMKVCRMRIPKALWLSLVTLAGVVLFFVFNVQDYPLYYKSLELGTAREMTILIKERGPLHMLYMLLLFGCVLLTLGVGIYCFIKKQKVSYKTISYLLAAVIITCICYVIERVLHLDFELVPIAYIVDELIFVALIRKISKYEITESIASCISENSKHGYIVFNKRGKYIGSNETAALFFQC